MKPNIFRLYQQWILALSPCVFDFILLYDDFVNFYFRREMTTLLDGQPYVIAVRVDGFEIRKMESMV